jgi:hypothetical protein
VPPAARLHRVPGYAATQASRKAIEQSKIARSFSYVTIAHSSPRFSITAPHHCPPSKPHLVSPYSTNS